MRRFSFLLSSLVAVSLLLWGCGGPASNVEVVKKGDDALTIPDWFLDPPKDPNFLFGTGAGKSIEVQTAKDIATTNARGDIAKALEVRYQNLTKQFREQVGTEEDMQYLNMFTTATKEVTSQVLNGVTIEKTKTVKEGSMWNIYVLMKLPIGQSSEALLNRLKQQQEMYTRFRASQVFDELEKETEAFEKWKTEQGNP